MPVNRQSETFPLRVWKWLVAEYPLVAVAGTVPATLKEAAVAVFLGIQNYDYYRLIGIAGHAEEMDAYFGTGNSHSCAVGRLSFFLGAKGPSVPVDTACSSSLVSTHLAVQSLRSGESSLGTKS